MKGVILAFQKFGSANYFLSCSSVGGLGEQIRQMREVVEFFLPEFFSWLIITGLVEVAAR